MKGLLLLAPVLSCVSAFIAYMAGGGLLMILAAFFLAGPLVTFIVGLILSGISNDSGDTK